MALRSALGWFLDLRRKAPARIANPTRIKTPAAISDIHLSRNARRLSYPRLVLAAPPRRIQIAVAAMQRLSAHHPPRFGFTLALTGTTPRGIGVRKRRAKVRETEAQYR